MVAFGTGGRGGDVIPSCAPEVAAAVGAATLMGFGALWIAQGLPDAIETSLALVVGAVAAFVAAPGVGRGIGDALVASLLIGCAIAAVIGTWKVNEMFSRAATYGIAYAGVLAFLAPYVADAPVRAPSGMGPTFQFIVAEISRAMASGFTAVGSLVPGVSC